jgi:phenylalanine-4-hydroxylase
MKEQKNENLSAYEKAAQEGIDPRCIPQWLDGPVPEHDDIKYPDYPETDQQTWKYLYERQMKFLPGRACNEYMEGTEELKLSPNKIPYLKELSHVFNKFK